MLFAVYAASFLYFFVDDEAIPLVYARNLLRGRGFVYTALEGRVEGYSDFLHVVWSTLLLAVTKALGLSLLTPLLVGKAVSFAAAILLIVVVARLLSREDVSPQGLTAATGFLALSGPLAVWACSSLEEITFALAVTAYFAALVTGARRTAVVLGIATVLLRIDGSVYVFALALAVAAAIPARRTDVWGIAWRIAAAALVYNLWRYWYFHAWLSAPLAAKVLYRLTGAAHAIVKAPDVPYLLAFAHVYGLASIAALAVVLAGAWRVPLGRASVIALIVLGVYVQTVGDWMFGWRFVVPLLPLAAVAIGLSVSRLPRTAGWGAAAVLVLWSAFAARRFDAAFVESERKPIFWTAPRGGEAVWLGRYYELIASSRRLMQPGDRIAYNQAGVLPYLLDLENIDDLGICSRFIAGLPTTDIYYTGVGRYSPLTNLPVLYTAHAYLLYQDVQFLVAPTDLLTRANDNTIPPVLLDGLFELAEVDASRANAIYRRTSRPADRYRQDPTLFAENLAHTSRMLRAEMDGREIPLERLGSELPFLRERDTTRSFTGTFEVDVSFAAHDEDVFSLFIGRLSSRVPCTLTLSLSQEDGRESARKTIAVAAGATMIHEPLPSGVRARAMSLKIDVPSGDDRITIADVRLEGQSRALRLYLKRHLTFTGAARGTH